MSFSKIIIIGNLGKNPELRYTPKGDAVCDFTVATNEKRGGQENTVWFKCTAWRQTAEAVAKYLTKGSTVYVEGKLSLEEWTDRDGVNRYTLNVNATDVQFLGAKGETRTDELPLPDNRSYGNNEPPF